MEELVQFLIEAKLKTYASGLEGKRLEDGSKELIYENGELRYRDKYFGFNPFIGQEIVFLEGKPIWGMNYRGEVVSDLVAAESIYEFLRRALSKIPEDKPFRGPHLFKEDDFEYENEVEGTIEKFKGIEKIFFKGRVVYVAFYHGGFLR